MPAALFQRYKELSFSVKLVLYLCLRVGRVRVFLLRILQLSCETFNDQRQCVFVSSSVKAQIVQAFEVTLDYIGGEGTNAFFDKKTVKRIQEIEDLLENDKT
ncbi:hypothetical protein TH53_12200 [Pedobacter lusitanus]|uniref:Uncharacterized protein n=1 Tax=Pedobacter lusitanus TaxID=1503925 RepID=A0A0D0FWM9_9SPHI|nr:hypothetical protein TH53_12200 [Pedobacter lusitanus]